MRMASGRGIRGDQRWEWVLYLLGAAVFVAMAIYARFLANPAGDGFVELIFAILWCVAALRSYLAVRAYDDYLARAREVTPGGPFWRYPALTQASAAAVFVFLLVALVAFLVMVLATLLLPPEWGDSAALLTLVVVAVVGGPLFLASRLAKGSSLVDQRRLFGQATWARGERRTALLDELVEATPSWRPAVTLGAGNAGVDRTGGPVEVYIDESDDPFSDAENQVEDPA